MSLDNQKKRKNEGNLTILGKVFQNDENLKINTTNNIDMNKIGTESGTNSSSIDKVQTS